MTKIGELHMADRAKRLAGLLGMWRPFEVGGDEEKPERYLLVEQSTYDGSIHFSLHENKEGAAFYHDTQEYPEDWAIKALVDLDSGEHYFAVPSTSFDRMPDGPEQEIHP